MTLIKTVLKIFYIDQIRRFVFCTIFFHIDRIGASFFALQKTNPGALSGQYQRF
jgi:hypothetical protein